jgi:ankyrin repeat protein
MSNATLPLRASLEYLRKLAKDRLADLRKTDPRAQLATALLSVAQDHGFSSWRALKAEVDSRNATSATRFFDAIQKGDVDTVRALLQDDPTFIKARGPRHNASALHFSCGNLEMTRVLLDAGADPNDAGDDTRVGVIGWATLIPAPGDDVPMDVVSLLLERGARHHIFSAIATGDLDVLRALVEHQPEALDQRLSTGYHGETALQFGIARNRPDVLDLLIELGADLEATDSKGQTALEFALLRGNRAAAARLVAAGAQQPQPAPAPDVRQAASDFASSVQGATLVIGTEDARRTLDWYRSIGFTEEGRFPTNGPVVFWGRVTLGKAELTFDVREQSNPRGVSLLITTDRVRDLYEVLKSRALESADVEFVETLHEPEHCGLEFRIRDPNGFTLRFLQESK